MLVKIIVVSFDFSNNRSNNKLDISNVEATIERPIMTTWYDEKNWISDAKETVRKRLAERVRNAFFLRFISFIEVLYFIGITIQF